MTQPVQEPTTQRQVAGNNWAANQLLRRPAAPSGCPCPVEWAYAAGPDGSEDYTSGSYHDVVMSQYAIDPAATALEIFDSSKPFKVIKSGMIFISMQAEWAGAGYSDIRYGGITKAGGGFWINVDATYLPRVTDSDPYRAGQVATFGPLFCNCNDSSNIRLGMEVRQNTGIDQEFLLGSLGIIWFPADAPLDVYDASWFGDYVQFF